MLGQNGSPLPSPSENLPAGIAGLSQGLREARIMFNLHHIPTGQYVNVRRIYSL